MSPVVELLLIVVSLIAAFVWVLLYFFVVEGLLKRLVGYIFGVTVGASRLESRRVAGNTRFYVSGWSVSEPKSSGCLFDTFIWVIGGLLRAFFIGVPVGALLLLALFLFLAFFSTGPLFRFGP
jgi:hypothetical protein